MKTTETQTKEAAPKKPLVKCNHRWYYIDTEDEGIGWQKSYKHACEHCDAIDYFSHRVRD